MARDLDLLIQQEFPTVTVPRFSPLLPCSVGRTRLLMARDGLYLETAQTWGRLVKRLWDAPRPLPYGEVAEVDTFADILKEEAVRRIIRDRVIPAAAEFARLEREWAGFIGWHEADGWYEFIPAEFASTSCAVHYRTPAANGTRIVVDIHSHGRLGTFFSHTDDRDDQGGVKIAVVLGNYRETAESVRFDSLIRYAVEGFHFPGGYDGDD